MGRNQTLVTPVDRAVGETRLSQRPVQFSEWSQMAEDHEIDGWRERLRSIKLRLSRPDRLTTNERDRLSNELFHIERLLRSRAVD